MPATAVAAPTSEVRLIRRRNVLALAAAFVVFGCLTTVAHAQDWARTALDKSPRHREYVPIAAANGRTVNTFVVYPEISGKAPVVVLIHEIFGLSDWAKLMADELAAKGYIVVAPDLLSGTSPATTPATATGMAGMHPDAATATAHPPTAATGTDSYPSVDAITKAVSALPPAQVTADLDAVADYAVKLPSANGKLAVAGFCWGGGKTFSFATHRPGLGGAFVFYGPPPPAADMAHITAPVYGFYAGNDARITSTVPDTTTAMKAAGKQYEPVIYPGAGHGFMHAGQAPEATPENKQAWNQSFARLTEALHGMQ